MTYEAAIEYYIPRAEEAAQRRAAKVKKHSKSWCLVTQFFHEELNWLLHKHGIRRCAAFSAETFGGGK